MKRAPALSSQLVSNLLTQEDRWDLLQSLEKAKQLLYLKSTTSDHFLDQLRHDHAELLRAAWSQLFSEPSPSEILEVITLIEKSVNRLPVITLTLTYHPTRVQIKELASFIRSKINNQAILEFQFEPNLVGGLVVQAEGQNIDLSLRETLLHAKV